MYIVLHMKKEYFNEEINPILIRNKWIGSVVKEFKINLKSAIFLGNILLEKTKYLSEGNEVLIDLKRTNIKKSDQKLILNTIQKYNQSENLKRNICKAVGLFKEG